MLHYLSQHTKEHFLSYKSNFDCKFDTNVNLLAGWNCHRMCHACVFVFIFIFLWFYQLVKNIYRINYRKMGCGCEVLRSIIWTGFRPIDFGISHYSRFRPYFLGCGHKFGLRPVNLGFARWRKKNSQRPSIFFLKVYTLVLVRSYRPE